MSAGINTKCGSECDRCLYKNVVEGLSEGMSRIDALHVITTHIADRIAGYEIYDRNSAAQAACVAVDTIIRAVDRAKEAQALGQVK